LHRLSIQINNMFLIRSVNVSELKALVELCAEHAAYEKAAFDAEGKAEKLRVAIFEENRLYAWVVEAENVLVGFATATLEIPPGTRLNFCTWIVCI
jgi:hypothetical protein